MRLTLSNMPEELLERILAFAVTLDMPSSLRSSWYTATTGARRSTVCPCVAPLLVSGTGSTRPFLPSHRFPLRPVAAVLTHNLRCKPELGSCVRSIRVERVPSDAPGRRPVLPCPGRVRHDRRQCDIEPACVRREVTTTAFDGRKDRPTLC